MKVKQTFRCASTVSKIEDTFVDTRAPIVLLCSEHLETLPRDDDKLSFFALDHRYNFFRGGLIPFATAGGRFIYCGCVNSEGKERLV